MDGLWFLALTDINDQTSSISADAIGSDRSTEIVIAGLAGEKHMVNV